MPIACKPCLDLVENKGPMLKDHLVLQDFKDVFLDEVPWLPPKRYNDCTIVIVLGDALVSKVTYKMSTLQLSELKMQLQEL